eukprot:Skav204659  [mRNA]  locus=scaffold949:229596:231877:+ [translate_table: standard]
MAGVWSTSSQNFLDVGHTHEDVDGILSLCKSAIDSAQCLQTPQDVMIRLRDKLRPVFDSRGIQLDVEVVGAVRDWAAIAPDSVTFKNAFKIRAFKEGETEVKPIPHSFIYAQRKSLPGQGRGVRLSDRLPRHLRSSDEATARDDLFCLVKHEMCDEGLSQEPLLVWPAAFYQQSKHFLKIANTTQNLLVPEFEDERRSDIRKLMVAMRRDFPHLQRASTWYQSLLDRNPHEPQESYTKLSFLDNVPDDDYPSNQQFAAHFMEFLTAGYRSGLGNIDIRFNHTGDRHVDFHDVKFVDGQTKALIMIAICSFCAELEFGEQQCQDPQLKMVLQSFVAIKCAYEHFQDEGDHFLYSLRC